MKKVLIRITVPVVLLFLIFLGWIYYRQYKSFQVPFHSRADRIIRVNIDAIVKTMVFDFISPGNLTWKENKQKKKEPRVETGIDMPANVFVYTLKDHDPTNFFGYLRISEPFLFENFIKQKLGVDNIKTLSSSINSASAYSGRLNILFNEEEAVFAFSPFNLNADVNDVLLDFLHKKNVVSLTGYLLQRLKQLDGHISFLHNKTEGQINFSAGKIDFTANVAIDSNTIPDEIYHRKFNKESCIRGWLNADLSKWVGQKHISIKGHFELNLDSVFRYSEHYCDFEVVGLTHQPDTVFTYEYDDNFEMIEQKTIVEKQVPEIYFFMKDKQQLLSEYLKRVKILDDNLNVSSKAFPLYQLYGFNDSGFLKLSTNKLSTLKIEEMPSDYFFNLFIDFHKMRKNQVFPVLHKFLPKLDSIHFSGTKTNTNAAKIQGEIYFVDKKTISLKQIF